MTCPKCRERILKLIAEVRKFDRTLAKEYQEYLPKIRAGNWKVEGRNGQVIYCVNREYPGSENLCCNHLNFDERRIYTEEKNRRKGLRPHKDNIMERNKKIAICYSGYLKLGYNESAAIEEISGEIHLEVSTVRRIVHTL